MSHGAKEDLKGLKMSVALYVVVMLLKLGVYSVTHVMALLAEGLHTLSDIFVSGFLLAAALWSRRKADEVHMFGYGRAQYVGALVAATLFISFTSFELYREAVMGLLEGASTIPHHNVGLAIGVLVLSMLIGAVPIVVLLRQKSKGAAMRAQLLELINDQLGLLAALAGTVLVQFGFHLADPIAAMVVATIIAINGVSLFRENLSYLLGRSPGVEFMKNVEQTVKATPGVLGLHKLRGQQVGPDAVQLDMHVEVRRGMPIEEANDIAHAVEDALVLLAPGGSFVNVHLDPENPADRPAP
jgi:cation diffusion facilitator family transporter